MSKSEMVSIILCFVAGLFMLGDGFLWVFNYTAFVWFAAGVLSLGFLANGIFKITLALIIWLGAWFVQDHGHGREVLGGALVIIVSLVGLVTALSYLYLVVLIPGIIGGALAITGHRGKHPTDQALKK